MPEDIARLLAAERILNDGLLHRAVHVVLTLVMFWMAYIFLDNSPTFVPEAHVYDFAKQVMSERDWGFTALAIAVFGLVTSYSKGWKTRSTGAAVLSFGHAGLAFCFILGKSNVPSVGLLIQSAVLGAVLAYSTAYVGKRFSKRVDSVGPL